MSAPVLKIHPAALLSIVLMGAAPAPPTSDSSAFMAETDDAMARMHAAMEVAPTGDVDADFVAMMVPHHQGAIEMSQAVLRHGRNEQVRRLAQEIIVEQQQEIAAMRMAVGQSARAPLAGSPGPSHMHHDTATAQQEH